MDSLIQKLLCHPSTQVRVTLLLQLASVYNKIPEKKLILDLLLKGVTDEINKSRDDIGAIVDAYVLLLKEFAPFYSISKSVISLILSTFSRMKSRLQVHTIQLLASLPLADAQSFTDQIVELLPFALSRDSLVSREYITLLENWSSVFSFSQIMTILAQLQNVVENDTLSLILSFCKRSIREKWSGDFIVDLLCKAMRVDSSVSLHEILLLLNSLEREPSWRREDLTRLIDCTEEIVEKNNAALSYLDSVLLDEVCAYSSLHCRRFIRFVHGLSHNLIVLINK